MASGDGEEFSRPRVPLKRLSTKRFKTLDARFNDAARRRLRYRVAKEARQPGSDTDWDSIREAHDEGVSWTELSTRLAWKNSLTSRYMAGLPIPDGPAFWQSADDRWPDWMNHYHGLFG